MTPIRTLFAAILVLAAFPTFALASKTQESTFQDDPMLVYGTPEQMTSTLDTLQDFGVDRIRVSVFWDIIAPATDQPQKPAFDATDPAQYPAQHWARYDTLIQAAQSRGDPREPELHVARAALGHDGVAARRPAADVQPQPRGVRQLRARRGTRYSGSYAGLPRVDYWSIWNEPNQAGWLTPQWSPDPRNAKSQIDAAPAIYRNLVATPGRRSPTPATAWARTRSSSARPHRRARAPRRTLQLIDALKFIRRLYCVDNNLNVLKGAQASLRSCPGDVATFVAQNPALFQATGYAHHPYALLSPPSRRSRLADWVSMADLRALSRELARIYKRYGQKTQSKRGVPLYLTEYGYQTAPDPITRVSFNRQAAWINEAEYIAFKNPNVRAVNQFLLVDDKPVDGVDVKKNPGLAWRTFQSGLQSLAGKHKPSYKAYMTPIFVKQQRVRRGRSTGVFGMLRPAGPAPQSARGSSSAGAAPVAGRRARRSPSAAAPLLRDARHRSHQRLPADLLAQRRPHAHEPRRGDHRDALTLTPPQRVPAIGCTPPPAVPAPSTSSAGIPPGPPIWRTLTSSCSYSSVTASQE